MESLYSNHVISKLTFPSISGLSGEYGQKADKIKVVYGGGGCPDDMGMVTTLPDIWIPRRSGPLLANYLAERKINHNTEMNNLFRDAAEVNKYIDSKVRDLSEQLLLHVQQNEGDIHSIVDTINIHKRPLKEVAQKEFFNKVNELYQIRTEDLANYTRNGLALERERADGLRKVMRDYFQKLETIGHLPIKDLVHDFDDKIYEVNQQLLSNSRAYKEVETQLKVQADQSLIKVRSTLNQLFLAMPIDTRKPSTHCRIEERTILKPVTSSHSKMIGSRFSVTSILKYPLTDPIEEEVGAIVNRLVDAYRLAVTNVFTGFSRKLDDLHNTIANCNTMDCKDHGHTLTNLIHVLDAAFNRFGASSWHTEKICPVMVTMTKNETVTLHKSLVSLGCNLRDTYSILHDAAHLWDNHMLRSALAQKLTMATVEDLLFNHDEVELMQETALTVALEQLRAAPDIAKLETRYKFIVSLLTSIADNYLLHSTAEIGLLKKYLTFPKIMSKILLAEFNCFLEKHPRSRENESTVDMCGTGPMSPTPNNAFIRSILPREVLQTELQGVALMNWRNGFLEAFESNMSLVPDELQLQAQQWVDERSGSLEMRYSLKITSHNIRLERINACRYIRLAELQHHASRLSSHLEAIQNNVHKLPEHAMHFLSLDAKELYPFTFWLGKIENKINILISDPHIGADIKKLKMMSYAVRISKYRRLFEDSLDVAVAEFQHSLDQHIQEARVSNVRFASHLRLFSQHGRYAGAEAVSVSTALVKSNEVLEECSVRTLEALQERRIELLELADHRLLPTQNLVEEYHKLKSSKCKIVK